MSRNTSVVLGEHFDHFIATQIKTGRYGSASELIRTGLRLLEDHDTKLQTLRNYLTVGEKQAEGGDFVDVDIQEILNEIEREDT